MVQIRFWAMTVGITMLIWVAVDQSVTTNLTLEVDLVVEPAAAANMSIEETSRKQIVLELRGPKAAISQVDARGEKLPTVRITLNERASGSYMIDLVEELRQGLDGFPPGVAVVRTTPRLVAVEVDRYVEREVNVSVDTGEILVDDPQVVPDRIRVKVPEQQFEKLSADERDLVIPVDVRDTPEGDFSRQLPIPAMLRESVPIDHADPSEVRFVGRVVGRNETVRLPTVPIRVMLSSKDINEICARYRVHFSGHADDIVTAELHITGPHEVVRAIQENPRQYGVEGYVVLSREEAFKEREPGEQLLKTPSFVLPPGVILAADPAPVGIELTPHD